MTFYAAISSDYKLKLLKRSTLLGALGILPLLLAAWFGSVEFLKQHGFFLFMSALFVIALGMIPLRRAQRIENGPPRIFLDSHSLTYAVPQRKPLCIQRSDIVSCAWAVRGERYGILLTRNTTSPLFLPYFSKKTASQLSDALFQDVLHSE